MCRNQLLLGSLALSLLVLGSRAQSLLSYDLVETGNSTLAADGKHVKVHVPGLFSMVMDTRGPRGSRDGLKMTQSILMGLVKVDMDRANGTDHKFHGPIKVSVFGITVYDNKEPAPKLRAADSGDSGGSSSSSSSPEPSANGSAAASATQ